MLYKNSPSRDNCVCCVCLQPLSDVVAHVERGYRMEAPDGCPKEIYDIMLEAWNLDQTKRPDFATVSVKLENLRASTPASAPVQSNV